MKRRRGNTCGPESCWINDEGQLLQMATEDLAGIEKALKGSKWRRAVPGWSARREEWMLSFCEAVHLNKEERGERWGEGQETDDRYAEGGQEESQATSLVETSHRP